MNYGSEMWQQELLAFLERKRGLTRMGKERDISVVVKELEKFNITQEMDWNGMTMNLSQIAVNYVVRYWRGGFPFVDSRIRMIDPTIHNVGELVSSVKCTDIRLKYDPKYGFVLKFIFEKPILQMSLKQACGPDFGPYSHAVFITNVLTVINPEFYANVFFDFETAVLHRNSDDITVRVED